MSTTPLDRETVLRALTAYNRMSNTPAEGMARALAAVADDLRAEARRECAAVAETIRILHPPTPRVDDPADQVCATCRDDEPWPCPTLLALADSWEQR